MSGSGSAPSVADCAARFLMAAKLRSMRGREAKAIRPQAMASRCSCASLMPGRSLVSAVPGVVFLTACDHTQRVCPGDGSCARLHACSEVFSASDDERTRPTCRSTVLRGVRLRHATTCGTASGPVTTKLAIAAAERIAFWVEMAMSSSLSGRLPSVASCSESESTAAALASALERVISVLSTVAYLEPKAASQYSRNGAPLACSCAAAAVAAAAAISSS